jgi:hypothetical protein
VGGRQPSRGRQVASHPQWVKSARRAATRRRNATLTPLLKAGERPQFADALAPPARPGIGSTVLSATNAVGGNRATSTLRVPKTAPLSCELR